jgi:flagellar basal body rod protein FlgG
MSWKEKSENVKFEIITGDNKVYHPLWKGGEKTKKFNTKKYDFIDKSGSFIDRKNAAALNFPLIFWFQGSNHIDLADEFEESSNSGAPLFFKDENGQNIIGTNIQNFKLEGSNVQMSYGLTDLIILQRAYDANSKSITTADQMMQKALNMDA